MGCEWTANGQHHGCEHRGCEAHGRSGRTGRDRTADRSPLAQPVLLVDEVGQAKDRQLTWVRQLGTAWLTASGKPLSRMKGAA